MQQQLVVACGLGVARQCQMPPARSLPANPPNRPDHPVTYPFDAGSSVKIFAHASPNTHRNGTTSHLRPIDTERKNRLA